MSPAKQTLLAAFLAALTITQTGASYQTPVSKCPILPAPDACGPGSYGQAWCPCPYVYGPNYCVYPPFSPFNGILPGKTGQHIESCNGQGQLYGYHHSPYPIPRQAGGPGGPPRGPGGYPPPPGVAGGPGGGYPGTWPGGPPGPGVAIGPGGLPGQGRGGPGLAMGPDGIPIPGFSVPNPSYAPTNMPNPGYAPTLPYPGYAPRLPSPGYEPPPGQPQGPQFVAHPYARSPRDFFMWSEVMQDEMSRAVRPSLVP